MFTALSTIVEEDDFIIQEIVKHKKGKDGNFKFLSKVLDKNNRERLIDLDAEDF